MTFQPWAPSETLPQKESLEVHYSRGFLRSQPEKWFANLGAQWLPLFHSLDAAPKFVSATPRLDWPEVPLRQSSIEIDGERAVLGLDDHAVDILISSVSAGLSAVPSDIFLEYLERRLCSTLRAAWVEDEPMIVQYLSGGLPDDIEVTAAIQVRMLSGDTPFDLWIGGGPKAIERLDYLARKKLQDGQPPELGDQVRTVSVELAELWVPPALLIDYMRAGTVIDLERPSTPTARLLLEGEPWAEGLLCQCNDTLAVEIQELSDKRTEPVEGSTHLSVVLCSTQLDLSGVREHFQKGAILSVGIAPPPTAEIVIGGETVAVADIGEIDGVLAVQVKAMK